MEKKYVVVNIGCIECGVSSDIVGVFADQKRLMPSLVLATINTTGGKVDKTHLKSLNCQNQK